MYQLGDSKTTKIIMIERLVIAIEAEQVPASENANIDKFTWFQTFVQIAIKLKTSASTYNPWRKEEKTHYNTQMMCFSSIGPVFVFAGLYVTYLVISHCGCQDTMWQQMLDVFWVIQVVQLVVFVIVVVEVTSWLMKSNMWPWV